MHFVLSCAPGVVVVLVTLGHGGLQNLADVHHRAPHPGPLFTGAELVLCQKIETAPATLPAGLVFVCCRLGPPACGIETELNACV